MIFPAKTRPFLAKEVDLRVVVADRVQFLLEGGGYVRLYLPFLADPLDLGEELLHNVVLSILQVPHLVYLALLEELLVSVGNDSLVRLKSLFVSDVLRLILPFSYCLHDLLPPASLLFYCLTLL